MKFKDAVVEKLDLTSVDDIVRLIVEYLCGEKVHKPTEDDKELLEDLLRNAEKRGFNFNWEQFNELLLLLNQHRTSGDFFKFFFGKDEVPLHELGISLDDLRDGVIKFRGFAMLCFGNFQFAYKKLIQKNRIELEKPLKSYCKRHDDVLKGFEARPPKMLRVKPIERNETWYVGYLSLEKFKKDVKILKGLISSGQGNKEELLRLTEKYVEIDEIIKRVEGNALENTNIYLTWDYMDVYIATSMRHEWEFLEAFDFIKRLFNNGPIKKLHLRYFDPTQSKCKDRIDKGLIEGLMLKRVLCSIYMAQESDTMGKDSELAATLAQGKPVIAYIPTINIDEYSGKIKEYQLDYFEKRLPILKAEGIFEDDECRQELKSHEPEFQGKIDEFQKELGCYRKSQPLSLWEEKEKEFKNKCVSFPSICKILAIAEHYNFERRADTLKENHPLAIQVDLQSGVANGVLVVRSDKECAELLRRILTNEMEFTIKHTGEKGKGVTVLEEKVSGCPFRVVTDYEKLTNCFWNFYLTSD